MFTDRAVEYRTRNKVKHIEAVMCVVVQRMVEADCAGTGFSTELATSYPAIHVAALYGLGEGLVSGEITSDEWLLEKGTHNMIKRVCGSKRTMYRPLPGGGGVELVDVPEEKQKVLCLEDDVVKKVAYAIENIKELYHYLFEYNDIDTELAISEGNVLFLQCRPIVEMDMEEVLSVDSEAAKDAALLVRGQYSLLGASYGRLKVIRDFEALAAGEYTIEADDIVVTAKTSNYWNQYLTSLKGIVTVEGSPTAHPMLIGRERNLCVICGCPADSLDRLEALQGEWVTIDGLTKRVMLGRLPLHAAQQDEFQSSFEKVKVEKLMPSDDHLKMLQQLKRVLNVEGKWHIFHPNAYISPPWRQLLFQQANAALAQVKEIRVTTGEFLNFYQDQMPTFAAHEASGKIYHAYENAQSWDAWPYCLFNNMTLDECRQLRDLWAQVAARYLRACDALEKETTANAWKQYTETFVEMYGILHGHFALREYVRIQATQCAADLNVSHFHYDQIQVQQKDAIVFQEDDIFRSEVVHAATQLCNFDMLKGFNMYECVEALAQRYRVTKETDVAHPPPNGAMLEKILEAVQLVRTQAIGQNPNQPDGHVDGYFPVKLQETTPASSEGNAESSSLEEWFPESKYEDMRRWSQLAIDLRIQMCDLHQWKVRGNHAVRKGLTAFENKHGMANGTLFNLASPEAVEAAINKHLA